MKKEILVKVFAGAQKEEVVDDGKKLKVFVREPAQQGSANKAVCLALSHYFGCDLKNIVITRGHMSPNKIITIYP
ncbi:DUF167 domain-containing protein [Candidatus Nomurabacteria bacterium]|nr:DUF167 domain-containing protein [Candidatus Nomurabacteria bacterium]